MEKRATITISLPEQIAQSVERARKRFNMTRSEFFRALLRRELREDRNASYVAEKGGSFDFLKDEPEFWSLPGSLRSNVSLGDKELRKAREAFGKQWPQK